MLQRTLFVLILSQVLSFCSPNETDDSVIICISKTSFKYHARKCQGVRACTHELKNVSLAEARNLGRTACGYCY